MSSKKRWESVYAAANPLGLVQEIKRGLKGAVTEFNGAPPQKVRHLWIHLSSEPSASSCACTGPHSNHTLSTEDWLNVVDEAAALGATTGIVSVGEPLSGWPGLWDICAWAQQSHGMIVGLHLYGDAVLDNDSMAQLRKLDPGLLRVLVPSDRLAALQFLKAQGMQILPCDGLEDGAPQPACELPHEMTCVAPNGAAYTCGLVLGKEEFLFGNVFARRLDHVMDDDSLPHQVPAGTSNAPRRCDGCPPLMQKRMHLGS